MTSKLQKIGGRDIDLLLVGVGEDGRTSAGVGGITRLQKFLFLLEKEFGVVPAGEGFNFEPYKAGPYSPKLYDDLELLENLGLVRSEVSAEATDAEAAEVDRLTFEELMGEEPAADAYEERKYSLTRDGALKVKTLMERGELKPVTEAVTALKRKYGKYTLNDLLYYVYTKYPDMATESEIKDKVLRRGH